MSTFSKLTYHIVFGTKYREQTIHLDYQDKLYHYIGGIIRAHNGLLIQIGGIEDHIHILATLSVKEPISDVLREIKTNSSKWINEQRFVKSRFAWQKGYGIFTVSYSQLESVRQYILHQREHHKNKSFEEEYIAYLKVHDITFDPKYVFEGEFCN